MAARFEIRLEGQLGERWADWFEGMTLAPQSDGTTILAGPVADQAALQGLLRRVGDLGMTLVSVGTGIRDNHCMSEDADNDGRSTTRVVFALSVTSPSPIPAFKDIPAGRRAPRTDEFSYDFGTASSVDDMWGARAHTLDDTINAALDRLDETGIDPDELAADDRVVSARFSVSPGAETLRPAVVRRLARIHAHILMDSWG
jgi:hypothetical protein